MTYEKPNVKGFMDRNKVARESYEKLLFRGRDRVEVLFIAESPPFPDKGEYYFWRISSNEKPGNLLKYILTALYGAEAVNANAEPLLKRFVQDGYFLIDASEEPVNCIVEARAREDTVEKNVAKMVETVQRLNPRHIVVIKRTIYEQVKRSLSPSGYDKKILGQKGLSFPSHHHQFEFVNELKELLGDI